MDESAPDAIADPWHEKPRRVSCNSDNSPRRVLAKPEPSASAHFSTNVEPPEQAFLRDQLRIDDVNLSFLGIYSYATWLDLVVVAICAVCAIIAGALPPITAIIGSRIILAFSKAESRENDAESLLDRYVFYYVYILVAALVTWFVSTAGFSYTGARITRTIKLRYFAAILKQNMALFDDNGSSEFLSHLTDDTRAIQTAISFKLSQTISALGTLVAVVAVCFALDRILMLELTWSLAFGYVILYFGEKLTVRYGRRSIAASSASSAIIEEALGSIKTTTSLGMQPYIHNKYMNFVHDASKNQSILTSFHSTLIAICVASGYFNVALAFWQGSRRLGRHETSFTSIVAITIVTKGAAFCVLGVGANMEAFAAAAMGIRRLSRVIRRTSPIDSSSSKGHIPRQFDGTIELKSVKHIYPCRPSSIALDHVSIRFPIGQTIAIVGHSGSGKSSISSLLLRFYDPIAGRILLDGREISSYQLRWLRQQMAIVKQEPFMFNRSVYENIELGFTNVVEWKNMPRDERRHLVYRAAKIAQADEFIKQLPQGYDTVVGTRGSRLSGGQLQRVAIARALVGNPRILILDEATSALDAETEASLLSSMAEQGRQRTTVVIAHRLSTIRHADQIVVLAKGRVVESGVHADLLAARSHYYELIRAQNMDYDENVTADEDVGVKADAKSPDDKLCIANPAQEDNSAPANVSVDVPEVSDVTSRSAISSMGAFILKLNKGKMHWPLLGLICCVIAGGEEPASAVLFGKTITALARPQDETRKMLSDAAFYSWMFFMLASVMLVSCTIQGIAFSFSSKNLANRVRSLALQQYLRMDIPFFDEKENSAAALSGFLSNSTSDLAGLSGSALGIILICVSTLCSGVVVALALGWKLALVCFSAVPFVVGGGYFSICLVGAWEEKNEKLANNAAEFAGEALSGIQTIVALTREKTALDEFEAILDDSRAEALKTIIKTAVMYALSQSAYSACMALGFWYGGRLVLRGEYTLFQAVAVQTSMILSANSAGVVFSWTPSLGKAKQAATSLRRLLARKSAIDPSSPEGTDPGTVEGEVEFDSVSFAYPSSPDHLALNNLSLRIPAGANVAFVGATGSGKSTILSLIERFYDPTGGSILVDSKPIKTLRLSAYRRCIALVGQDPHLYRGTVRMNLILGLDDQESSDLTDEEVKRACQAANIYDFVMSLPDGFSTEVGNRGCQFSVGQKQRIVLARALLRNARILLLDEATSALDSRSEAAIQEALEIAKKGRTTITVAHRLSTVAKADRIYVIAKGGIVEAGTHGELVQAKGHYFRLYMASKSG
ncbi:hypothetical protein EsDP_00003272 [Epichloe bromicola]|uniref:Uncharacterized protein n=1 Tax=Epichloe bromicola TaxID=79588 RepID=A0ABQ0CNA4_9HYPO